MISVVNYKSRVIKWIMAFGVLGLAMYPIAIGPMYNCDKYSK